MLRFSFIVSLMVLWLTQPQQTWAQVPATPPPLQVGVGWWGYNYLGDLSEELRFGDRAYPGIRLSMQFDGRKALQLQFNVGYGRIVDQTDLPPVVRQDVTSNTYVETPFFFTDLRLRWFFLRFDRWESYVSAGGGLMFFRPLDQFGNFLGENFFSRLPEEQYNTNTFAPPLGFGVQVRINPVLRIGVEYTHFFTLTDYLDNIGQLGIQSGNDRMQGLGVNMMLNLNAVPIGQEIPPQPEPEPPALPEAAPLAWSFEQETTLLSYWELAPISAEIRDRMVLPRLHHPLFYALTKQINQRIESGTWPTTNELSAVEVPLAYAVSVSSLASLFQLPAATLTELNPQWEEVIPTGSRVMVPNAFLVE